jgi:hypothetical protein
METAAGASGDKISPASKFGQNRNSGGGPSPGGFESNRAVLLEKEL